MSHIPATHPDQGREGVARPGEGARWGPGPSSGVRARRRLRGDRGGRQRRCSPPRDVRSVCPRKAFRARTGSNAARSRSPFPGRTVIWFRSRSMTFMRSDTHSIRRSPLPYSNSPTSRNGGYPHLACELRSGQSRSLGIHCRTMRAIHARLKSPAPRVQQRPGLPGYVNMLLAAYFEVEPTERSPSRTRAYEPERRKIDT